MPAGELVVRVGALYARTDPLLFAVAVCAVLAAACWLVSVLTGNYSQVDRLWSLAPPLYACHFAARAGWVDRAPQCDCTPGGAVGRTADVQFRAQRRLPLARLRTTAGRSCASASVPCGFNVLNATFVAPYQNLLLLLIVLPASVAWQARGTPLNALDGAAAVAFVLLLIGETIADQQQWRFQCAKQARKAAGEADRQPSSSPAGLFRYSRHPNFFCEQAMWWMIYVFSIAASGVWLNWSIAGALLLTLLFQGSTRFTEELTLRKYPAYRAYQQTTSRLIPWFPSAQRKERSARQREEGG